MRGYEWPAFDLGGFGGHGGMGGLGGYAAWNTGFNTPYYDVPGSVEQATRSHVEAQTEFEKAKEKYEEAKKKFEECEKKVIVKWLLAAQRGWGRGKARWYLKLQG
ncbi:hypothetical protein J4E91_007098 [Alternaria rosae]|nr:hypothetical protein J4E91_007098 [Alternaria rosae]